MFFQDFPGGVGTLKEKLYKVGGKKFTSKQIQCAHRTLLVMQPQRWQHLSAVKQ